MKEKIFYLNLLTGVHDKEYTINDWFSNFLDSFTESEYHAQQGRLRPLQYKNLMTLVESNHWKMLSSKQWDIFCKYLNFTRSTWEEFANFKHNERVFNIRVSNTTGFVTIKISK